MTREAGRTKDAPPPAGPYSQSVRIGNVIACAGQAGLAPTGELAIGLADQTRQALQNIAATLAACGADIDDVIHVRVYLTDPMQSAPMNESYEQFFSEPYPARTTVYVGLPEGLLVEIDALAVLSGTART